MQDDYLSDSEFDEEILERFYPQYATEREPDIDEQIKELRSRKILAEREYRSSEQTKEDYQKLNYTLLAIEENINRLLEKKLAKAEVETSEYRSAYYELLEKTRFHLAERLFLCLLCGFATTVLLPEVESIMDFISRLMISSGSLLTLLLLTSFLFPKEKSLIWLPGYEKHPYISAVIMFIIVAAVVTVIKTVR